MDTSNQDTPALPDDLYSEALLMIESHAEDALPEPDLGENPKLPIADIRMVPEIFQPRGQGQNAVSDEFHVEELAQQLSLKLETGLDPIVVFWSGREWLLVDGHHRLAAYKESEEWGDKPVPVSPFKGSLQSALVESVGLNSKVYLQFDQQDRLDAAWRLLCLGEPKADEVITATGVSRRQVFKMKRRQREILEAFPENTKAGLAEYTWRQARGLNLEGLTELPERDEDWERKLAADWKRRLQKTFGNKITKNPEAFAMALRQLNSGLPAMLMETHEWSDIKDRMLDAWVEARDLDETSDF